MNIICVNVTNKGYTYLQNIINNFIRQDYENKKLIIIFNSNINKDTVKDILYSNGIMEYILEIIPDKTLGECLNHSTTFEYDIWCKMDDDDYYGKDYLKNSVKYMISKNADIVGKRDMYIYVPELKKIFFKQHGGSNKYINWIHGSSLIVHKKVFNTILFPHKNRGEDTQFQQMAFKRGFKIYATTTDDFIYIRRLNNRNHTWIFNLKEYLKNSTSVPLDGIENHIC